MKRLLKGLFLISVLSLLALGGSLAWLASLRLDKIADLAAGSQIAPTAAGPIEYCTLGEGPPVLILHGILGGYDQGRLLGAPLAQAGFRVVSVSRPGYLRTPLLRAGNTPEQQADAMAALLDTLDIPRISIVAWSAGGPIALQFAARYPNRLAALVLLSPVTEKFQAQSPAQAAAAAQLAQAGFLEGIAAPLLVRYASQHPREALRHTLSLMDTSDPAQRRAMVDYIAEHPARLEWYERLLNTLAPLDLRLPGMRNDLAQHQALQPLPLEKVSSPTLVIHGQADKVVPYAGSERASSRISQASLLPVAGAGHLVPLAPEADLIQHAILDFLRQHL